MRQRYAINAVGKRLRGHYDSVIDSGPGRTMEDVVADFLKKEDKEPAKKMSKSIEKRLAVQKESKPKKPAKKPVRKVPRSGKHRKD